MLQQVLAPSGMRTSVRDTSRELPENVLPVMLVAVFLTKCYKTEWLLASERHGGRESAVASKACLYCCTLPSPAASFSVSRVCLLSASGEARAEGVAGRADARTCWRELVAGGLTREKGCCGG